MGSIATIRQLYESQAPSVRQAEEVTVGLAIALFPSYYLRRAHWSVRDLTRSVGVLCLFQALMPPSSEPMTPSYHSHLPPMYHQPDYQFSRFYHHRHVEVPFPIPGAPVCKLNIPEPCEDATERQNKVIEILYDLTKTDFKHWETVPGYQALKIWREKNVLTHNTQVDLNTADPGSPLKLALEIYVADRCEVSPWEFSIFSRHFALTLDTLLPFATSEDGLDSLIDTLHPLWPSVQAAHRINVIKGSLRAENLQLAPALDALLAITADPDQARWIRSLNRQLPHAIRALFQGEDKERKVAAWVRQHASEIAHTKAPVLTSTADSVLYQWALEEVAKVADLSLASEEDLDYPSNIPSLLEQATPQMIQKWCQIFSWTQATEPQLIELGIMASLVNKLGLSEIDTVELQQTWAVSTPMVAFVRNALSQGLDYQAAIDKLHDVWWSLVEWSDAPSNETQQQLRNLIDTNDLEELAIRGKVYQTTRQNLDPTASPTTELHNDGNSDTVSSETSWLLRLAQECGVEQDLMAEFKTHFDLDDRKELSQAEVNDLTTELNPLIPIFRATTIIKRAQRGVSEEKAQTLQALLTAIQDPEYASWVTNQNWSLDDSVEVHLNLALFIQGLIKLELTIDDLTDLRKQREQLCSSLTLFQRLEQLTQEGTPYAEAEQQIVNEVIVIGLIMLWETSDPLSSSLSTSLNPPNPKLIRQIAECYVECLEQIDHQNGFDRVIHALKNTDKFTNLFKD